ncbi:MAG: GFA family protein, partial [Bacteroidota bacterium]|nr:GFA family protein [Kiloniellaceae bacterium]
MSEAQAPASEGGCLCGALRYRIIPGAELCVYCCHCRDCQRLSSSAYAVCMVLPDEAFTLLR